MNQFLKEWEWIDFHSKVIFSQIELASQKIGEQVSYILGSTFSNRVGDGGWFEAIIFSTLNISKVQLLTRSNKCEV